MKLQSEIISNFNLASRWDRLWASIIDSVIGLLVGLPLMLYLDVFQTAKETGGIPFYIGLQVSIFSWVIFFIINGSLLKQRGQTIGKNLLNIAIISTNGTLLSLPEVIGKRFLPVILASHVPFIGRYLLIIDPLFIFRKDKRCIHDLIANTVVVDIDANKSLKSDGDKAASL